MIFVTFLLFYKENEDKTPTKYTKQKELIKISLPKKWADSALTLPALDIPISIHINVTMKMYKRTFRC